MKGLKKLRIAVCFLIITIVSNTYVNPVFAETVESALTEQYNELILVLDTSGSMESNDASLLALDCLKQLTESLPTGWRFGLVTYNSQVVNTIELTDQTQAIHNTLAQTKYNGYTNTSAGINQAMTLFSENALSKQIVLLTDGEILMPSDAETQAAVTGMDATLQNAGNAGIPIHTIGLGDSFQAYDNSVKRSSEATGGRLFEVPSASGLSTAVNQLLFETFGIKHISVGSAQMSGSNGAYQMELPVSGIAQAKILITSEYPVSNIAVSCEGSDIQRIIPGERFAVVTIDQPASREITVSFTSSGASTADMILSCDLPELAINTEYQDEKVKISEEVLESQIVTSYEYKRTATLQIELIGPDGSNLFQSLDLSGSFVTLNIDGAPTELEISDGSLIHSLTVTESRELSVAMSLALIPFNFPAASVTTSAPLEGPPEAVQETLAIPVEEPNTISLWILIVTLSVLCIVVISLLLFFRKRDKKAKQKQALPRFDSKFEFTGKLNIYITKTTDDEDIPPLTFDLFRLNRNREITVKDMLDKCGIHYKFPGSEKITFVAGRNGSLQIVNDSDCTVLIGRDILIKRRSHLMEYGEKIDITCDDDSEMELHYRSVKPSEKNMVADQSIRYLD